MVIFKEPDTKTGIGILTDYEELDPSSKQVVAEKLVTFYFAPEIKRIYHIGEKSGTLTWQKETTGDVTPLKSGKGIICDGSQNGPWSSMTLMETGMKSKTGTNWTNTVVVC
jgi:hypothetical protein